MSDIQQRISRLSPAQRALFEQRLEEGGAAAPKEVEIKRRKEPGPYPLSVGQEQMWFQIQLTADPSSHHSSTGFRLTGRLDVGVLERAVNEVIRRHENLRTTFRSDGGLPVPVIAPSLTLKLAPVEVGGADEEEQMAGLRRLFSEAVHEPFDLTEGPLIRIVLARLADEDHALLLVIHHIVTDRLSSDVLLRELTALYDAFAHGRPSPLPELPIQYADFAAWQRQWLRGETLQQQLDYWKRRLAGAPARLALPADRPRPSVQIFKGADYPFRLPESLADELRALSRREGVTLFMTLLAAWQTLLSRYAGQTDVVVGTPVAGRNRAELEGLVGLFVNTLALRTDLSGGPTFRELLARVREVCLGAYLHQDLPFDTLVEELGVAREAGHAPLYRAVFAMDNAPAEAWALPGLTLRNVAFDAPKAKSDLTLSMREEGRALAGTLNYRADLFDAETVAQMADHLAALLAAAAADPDRRVSELPPVAAAERQQLLAYSRGEPNPGAADKCVHDLFSEQAARTPGAVAVEFGNRRVTYAELDGRAEALARRLRGRGVGPAAVVGVCLGRSVELVVALLGVLKAGGAFVNLDLTLPPARLAFMLEDARPRLLLAQKHLAKDLPPFEGEVFYLDEEEVVHPGEAGEHPAVGEAATEEPALPRVEAGPDNLACVFYTSGSTGRPKGVMAAHRGVVNFLTCAARRYALSASDAVLQLASLSFDASLRDLLGPLTFGARLILLTDDDVKEPAAVLAAVEAHRVTCLLSVVPARLKSLTEAALARGWSYAGLRLVLCSGEKLTFAHCAAARQAFGERLSVVNLYGPTECTMTQSSYRVGAASEGSEGAPVGRPIAETRIYVLGEGLDLAPLGVAGEVYIGGAGVTRGYLNRPGLTAERFVPDPHSGEPGARLYRTGDVARYLMGGDMELLGRLDAQIKLRGMRIEPGEVEAAVRRHGAVREAAVAAREDAGGERRLVCYLIIEEGREAPGAEGLREFLRGRLPDYMVPSAYVVLDALPLLPSGKLDRGALPSPDMSRPAREPGT
jgi:pristinamycin I synthase-3/4